MLTITVESDKQTFISDISVESLPCVIKALEQIKDTDPTQDIEKLLDFIPDDEINELFKEKSRLYLQRNEETREDIKTLLWMFREVVEDEKKGINSNKRQRKGKRAAKRTW